MADFINTIDLLGDEVVAGMIVDGSITEFNDDVLTVVEKYAFAGCSELTSVSLPNVTILKEYCFQECKKLTSISLLNATTLESYVFYNCYKLETVTIPKVTSIGSSAFSNVNTIKSMTLPAIPPTLEGTFRLCSSGVFHIPAGSLSAYQNATNWSTMTEEFTFLEDA